MDGAAFLTHSATQLPKFHVRRCLSSIRQVSFPQSLTWQAKIKLSDPFNHQDLRIKLARVMETGFDTRRQIEHGQTTPPASTLTITRWENSSFFTFFAFSRCFTFQLRRHVNLIYVTGYTISLVAILLSISIFCYFRWVSCSHPMRLITLNLVNRLCQSLLCLIAEAVKCSHLITLN